jgi:outer membrane protein assembly factor BamB
MIISIISMSTNAVMIKESEKTDDQIEWIYKPCIEPKSKIIDQHEHPANAPIIYTQSNQIKQSIDLLNGPIDSAWPMASHDNHHTGLSPYTTVSNPGHEIWRYCAEGAVDTGIAIDVDGTLYFGDFHGDLTALNPDGSVKWKYTTGHIITMSTPCISEDGALFFGSHDDRLYALNPDGSLKWKINLGGSIGGTPAIADDGTIYVGHHGDEMVAVNPNGSIKWKYPTGDFITSDPAIADDGTIIFGSADDWVFVLHPNGTLKWKYETPLGVKGGASIDDNGIIYIASWGGYLYAFYPNGTVKWETEIGEGSETTPCFGSDGTIYVSYNKLWAINPTDGSVKWTFEYLENNELSYLSNPAISADGIIYIGTEIDEVDGRQIYG